MFEFLTKNPGKYIIPNCDRKHNFARSYNSVLNAETVEQTPIQLTFRGHEDAVNRRDTSLHPVIFAASFEVKKVSPMTSIRKIL